MLPWIKKRAIGINSLVEIPVSGKSQSLNGGALLLEDDLLKFSDVDLVRSMSNDPHIDDIQDSRASFCKNGATPQGRQTRAQRHGPFLQKPGRRRLETSTVTIS